MEHSLLAGLVPLHVLHHACKEPVFGLELIEELGRHGYRLSPGTLYPLLHGMEVKGLLKSRKELAVGKVRRVYRASPAGHKLLAIAKDRVRELFGELFEEQPGVKPAHSGHRNLRKHALKVLREPGSQFRSK
jgi:PadR family transcriptional regulator PadR